MTIPQHKGTINRRYGGIWNKERDEVVYANYGTMTAEHLAARINSLFGTNFTFKAINQRANDLGIDARDCQGMLTITDAARELGIDYSALSKFIIRHNLSTVGKGKSRYLTDDTWRVAQATWPPTPEPWVSVVEAGRRLNFAECTIWRCYIKTGKLKAYRFGKLWRVSLSDLERMEREQRGGKYL